MDSTNLNSSEQTQADTHALSISQMNENVCESQHLNSELSHLSPLNFLGEQEPSFSKRTEAIINDFSNQLDSIIESKSRLIDQFSFEKKKLKEEYDHYIIGMRQKHALCEQNFKKELENVNAKFKELDGKYNAEVESHREDNLLAANKLAEAKKEAESTKHQLENIIINKERALHVIEEDKTKLESRLTLLEKEFNIKKSEFENKISEYESNQEEDALEITQLKERNSTSLKEISDLRNTLDELAEKYKLSEENFRILKEESVKIKEQLQIEERVKQEKIEAIHSLTATLNESKTELEQLRNNFDELETTRRNEVRDFKAQLSNKEASYEKMLNELKTDKLKFERKHKEEVLELNESIRLYQSEQENMKSTLEQKNNELFTSTQQFERKIKFLELEKAAIGDKFTRLEEQHKEINNKLSDANVNYDLCQRELSRVKSNLVIIENERDKRQEEFFRIQESYKELEIKYSYTKSELEEFKQLLESQKAANEKKSIEIDNLQEQLFSSQSDIDELKNLNEKLKRSNKEHEDSYRSLLKDRDELAATLTQIERSRHEINTKFDNSKYSCISLENKLKLKEGEVKDLTRRIETLDQENKLLKNEIDSAGKSLKQMKQLNEQLHEQTLSLQKRNSTMESKSKLLEPDWKYSSSALAEKDAEIRRARRESEFFRERISKLENEKHRIERSYANLEKENTALKDASRPAANPRASSPSTRYSSDQTSILSLTRLLSDTNFGNSSKLDFFSDEAIKVTRGIEALEQQHMEIQKKVMGLENLIEEASSESDANTTKHSEDFSELKQIESVSHKSSNVESFDFNGNYNDVDEKLRRAQLKAQNLIDSSPLFEKEFMSRKVQTQSYQTHVTIKSDDSFNE